MPDGLIGAGTPVPDFTLTDERGEDFTREQLLGRTTVLVLEELAHLSVAACEFWALGERVAFLPLAERACQVLASFGKAMGIDVVTREHVDLSSRVRAIGGAYKPSGAGGGDVGVAFFVNVRARRALARALRGTAYRIVAES